jgi:hypothetical protein
LRTLDFNLLPRSARAKKSMQDYGQTLLVSRADQKCDSQSEMIVDRVNPIIARERSDEAIQTRLTELRLDCFVAALPRNDES